MYKVEFGLLKGKSLKSSVVFFSSELPMVSQVTLMAENKENCAFVYFEVYTSSRT